MFSQKKSSLFEVNSKNETSSNTLIGIGTKFHGNAFVNAGLKKSAETLSGNGALKYNSTGNDFVDQFGKLGSYKEQRSFDEISYDCNLLWSQNPRLSLCFIFFIRMITRVVALFNGIKTNTVQRGAGLKHEGIMRMVWVHINHPDSFWKNITLYISIASWKDIFQMLQYDLEYNGWDERKLNWNHFGDLIIVGLESPNTVNLVKKYLPQIKARKKCTTMESQAETIIGKWICSRLNISYKEYRKLKTSGTAHEWQKLISNKLFDSIDFSSIHGRALTLIVSSKFITNHDLDVKYEEWIKKQPVAKFTGYVHELMSKVRKNMKPFLYETINKQFYGLIETGHKNAKTESSLIVVRDTSSSMSSMALGTKISCGDIGKSLALYFSEFLTGYFTNTWIEFNNNAKLCQWKGATPVDKWLNDNSYYVGSTNFQSVISLFVKLKNDGINENEFPSGILCISDGEFNPTQLDSTNVQEALLTLRDGGFSEDYIKHFKIILWNLQSNYYGKGTGSKFETYGAAENVYYFSGYDASIIAFLTGVEGQKVEPKNAEELFTAAMNQEIMDLIQI